MSLSFSSFLLCWLYFYATSLTVFFQLVICLVLTCVELKKRNLKEEIEKEEIECRKEQMAQKKAENITGNTPPTSQKKETTTTYQ